MSRWKHDRPKPVIGLAGGIGSGKTTISRMFASLGCAVIDSDKLAHQILQSPEVKEELRDWLGGAVFNLDGSVNRRAVAQEVFDNPADVQRLNDLIHPGVARRRDELMSRFMADPAVRAVIWDSPLLLEAGLHRECDVVVFTALAREKRVERLVGRGGAWTVEELDRREKLQFPLDKKANLADYCVDNSGDEASSLRQVQRVLSELLDSTAPATGNEPIKPQ